jgi:hypothetical protein
MTKYSPLTNIFNIEYVMIFPNRVFYTKFVVKSFKARILNLIFERLIWLRQLGLLNHWKRSRLPRQNRCSVLPSSSLRSTGKNKRLNLNYLSSAFLLYGVGITCTVVAFLFELLIFSIQSFSRRVNIKNHHSQTLARKVFT